MDEIKEDKEKKNGVFVASLKRDNSKIKSARADAIIEDTELAYKRLVEDLSIELKKKTRERDNMLDLSPTDANSLILAKDFNAVTFAKKDMGYSLEIRNLEIKLEIAEKRYAHLFGGE